jgi:uncharacterized protein
MTNIKPRTSRRVALVHGLAALLLAATGAFAQNAPQTLRPVTLSAGIHNISAMVAQTPDERSTGLMFRSQMAPNEGMIFVFEDAAQQCFWMKNTLLPLSAAFVADDGMIVNIEDMAPQTLDSHCSKKPVRYVLEMHKGWFAKRGIQPGQKLAGPMFRK